MSNGNNGNGGNAPPQWATIVSVVSGIVFLITLLVIAVFIPDPTRFQLLGFRVVLALAAAGFAAAISGFLTVNLPLWGRGTITAGGALAVFAIVYQVNPPEVIHPDAQERSGTTDIKQATTIGALVASKPWQNDSLRVTLTSATSELQNFLFDAGTGPKHELVQRWCASPCLVCEPAKIDVSTREVRVSLQPGSKVKRTLLGAGYPKNVNGPDGKPVHTYQAYEIVDQDGQRYAYVCDPLSAASAKRDEFNSVINTMQAEKLNFMAALNVYRNAEPTAQGWAYVLYIMEMAQRRVQSALDAAVKYNASLPTDAKDQDFQLLEELLHKRTLLFLKYLPNGQIPNVAQAGFPDKQAAADLYEKHQKLLDDIKAAQQRVNKEK